jgi:hypothetical protein
VVVRAEAEGVDVEKVVKDLSDKVRGGKGQKKVLMIFVYPGGQRPTEPVANRSH